MRTIPTRPLAGRGLLAAVLLLSLLTLPAVAGAQRADDFRALAEEILEEAIGYRSSAEHPEQTRALAEAMARRLLEAGFPTEDVQVVSPDGEADGEADGAASVVARYRGSGAAAPILLMAHLDVVDADPSGWSFPPFEFGKDDAWYYGRGTTDNKAGVATLMAGFLRLREEGFAPSRDLIMVLSGDEETAGAHIDWLVNERRDLVDAAFALNTDAGGGTYDDNGEPRAFHVQAAEKMYQSFRLTSTNPGGHSSVPRPDNAIYDLAGALTRIAEYRFPIMLNDISRAALAGAAARTPGQPGEDMRDAAEGDLEAAERVAASDPYLNSTLRTTCVATRLRAGHADNALPRSAEALVNCRIFPGVPADDVEATLRRVVDDEGITFARVEEARPSPPSPLDEQVLAPIRALVEETWPGTPVIPSMSTGATDGLFVRNAGIPVYGLSAIYARSGEVRAHGLDERVGIEEFHRAAEFWYRMLKQLAE